MENLPTGISVHKETINGVTYTAYYRYDISSTPNRVTVVKMTHTIALFPINKWQMETRIENSLIAAFI